MTRFLRNTLSSADASPPHLVLWINAGLAAFVALAHGGALMLSRMQPQPQGMDVKRVASVSLPLAALVLVTALLALGLRRIRPQVLALHGVIFLFAAAVQVVWGGSLLINGIPEGNFSWSVGIFTAIATYAVFVHTRFAIPARMRSAPVIFYAPVIALVVAALIDIGVIIRFAHGLSSRFAG